MPNKAPSFVFRTECDKLWRVRRSKDQTRWVVRVASEDWDLEDCEDAAAMTEDIKECQTLEDCLVMLGVN